MRTTNGTESRRCHAYAAEWHVVSATGSQLCLIMSETQSSSSLLSSGSESAACSAEELFPTPKRWKGFDRDWKLVDSQRSFNPL